MLTEEDTAAILGLRARRRALLAWFGEHADLKLQDPKAWAQKQGELYRVSHRLYKLTQHPPFKPATLP